jgi:hypothetical protein
MLSLLHICTANASLLLDRNSSDICSSSLHLTWPLPQSVHSSPTHSCHGDWYQTVSLLLPEDPWWLTITYPDTMKHYTLPSLPQWHEQVYFLFSEPNDTILNVTHWIYIQNITKCSETKCTPLQSLFLALTHSPTHTLDTNIMSLTSGYYTISITCHYIP